MSATLWQVWSETVADAPGAPVLLDAYSGETVSRRDLNIGSEKLSASLGNLDGRVVAFAEPNGPGWIRAFLAIQRAGAIALPLDAGLPPGGRMQVATLLAADFLLAAGRVLALDRPRETVPFATEVGVSLLKLTSGSTTLPRTLPFTSAQMLADGRQVCDGMGIGPGDVNFGIIPWGHSYGLGNLIMPLIERGTTVAFSSETLPGGLADDLSRSGATVFPAVPPVLRALTESAAVRPEQLGSLRTVISAGGFLRPDVATNFYDRFQRFIHNFYGSSETGGICFDVDGQATRTGRSVGKPLPSVQVSVEPGRDQRVRVTSAAVTGPGSHLLPDRGEWTAEGELRLLGRLGSIANVGGRKVDPGQVEQTLRSLPGVSDAWVAVRTRPSGDDYLVAAVETHLASPAVSALLATRLPPWQVPRRMVTEPRLPRNERGKLDRAELEARFP